MFTKTTLLAAGLIVAAHVAIGTANAQRLTNPFSSLAGKFTNEDLKQMKAASASLYANDVIISGHTTKWLNEKSGTGGIVTLQRRYDYKGMICATLRHHIKVKGSLDPINLSFDRCKTADGQWKLR